jgi:hypothetical protein
MPGELVAAFIELAVGKLLLTINQGYTISGSGNLFAEELGDCLHVGVLMVWTIPLTSNLVELGFAN